MQLAGCGPWTKFRRRRETVGLLDCRILSVENFRMVANLVAACLSVSFVRPAGRPALIAHRAEATRKRNGHLSMLSDPGPTTAQLRQELVSKALAFRTLQEQRWEQESVAADDTFALGREANDVTRSKTDERLKSPLAAEGFGNVELAFDATLTELRNEIVALIEALSARSPTPEPFAAWRQSNAPEGACPLEGQWMLLFTTGADATFRKTDKQGQATTFTQISAKRGHIVNCVDFSSETAKLQGFRVVVAGFPLSADEVQLKFRRVKLLRRSHWLKTVVIPLPPSRLLRALSRWASRGKGQLSRRGAGFKVLYLDATMRMHLTFDGQYFVQMRPEAFEAAIAAQAS